LFVHKKKHRRAVEVDEAKVKLENQWIYIWSAIDVDNREVIAIHVSTTRTSLNALYFLRKVLECLTLVDGGPWYRWALQRLGLRYDHQTFGEKCYRAMVQPVQSRNKEILEEIPISQLAGEYQNLGNGVVCHL